MRGRISKTTTIFELNTNTEVLLAPNRINPDGSIVEQHWLPCNECGTIVSVDVCVVSTLCTTCYERPGPDMDDMIKMMLPEIIHQSNCEIATKVENKLGISKKHVLEQLCRTDNMDFSAYELIMMAYDQDCYEG